MKEDVSHHNKSAASVLSFALLADLFTPFQTAPCWAGGDQPMHQPSVKSRKQIGRGKRSSRKQQRTKEVVLFLAPINEHWRLKLLGPSAERFPEKKAQTVPKKLTCASLIGVSLFGDFLWLRTLSLAPLPSLLLSFMITGMELGAVMRTTGVHVGVMKQFGWWCCCCSCLRTLENTKEVNSGRGFQDLHVPMLVAFLVYSLSRPTFRCSGLWRPSDGWGQRLEDGRAGEVANIAMEALLALV